MRGIFMVSDYEAMYDFLEKYQKTRPEWDVFRGKIPEVLLNKWGRVVKECRQNGFISPTARDKKIIFHQVKSHVRNNQNNDKCTICLKRFIDYECDGKTTLYHGQYQHVKCWEPLEEYEVRA